VAELTLPVDKIAATMVTLIGISSVGVAVNSTQSEERVELLKLRIKRGCVGSLLFTALCVAIELGYQIGESEGEQEAGDEGAGVRFWLACFLVNALHVPTVLLCCWRFAPTVRDSMFVTIVRRLLEDLCCQFCK